MDEGRGYTNSLQEKRLPLKKMGVPMPYLLLLGWFSMSLKRTSVYSFPSSRCHSAFRTARRSETTRFYPFLHALEDDTPSTISTTTRENEEAQPAHLDDFIRSVSAECGYIQSFPSREDPNLSTFHRLLHLLHQSRSLVPQRRITLARNVLSHIMDHPTVRPTVQTLNLVLSAYTMKHHYRASIYQEATDLFRRWQDWYQQGLVEDDVNLMSYNKLIEILSRSSDLYETEQLFQEILQRSNSDASFRPDIVTYGGLLFVYAVTGHKEQVKRLLEEMISDGPQPSILSLNDILHAYSISKDSQNAMDFLQWWESSVTLVAPDIRSYNVVLRSVARSTESNFNYSNARDFFDSIPIPKDKVTYTTMIGICSRNLKGSSALEAMSEILNAAIADQRIVLDNALVTNVLYSLAATSDEKAPRLADSVVAVNCGDNANVFVYEALAYCWSKSMDPIAPNRALEILDTVETSKTVKPTVKLYTNVIGALHNFPGEEAVRVIDKLLTKMETSGPPPNAVTYSAAIGIISRSELSDKATIVYNLLQRMKVPPSIIVYNGILNACEYSQRDPSGSLENLRIACDVFVRVRNDTNVHPTHITYGSFISTLGRLMEPTAKRDNVVLKIFRQCCREGQVNSYVINKMKAAMVSKEAFRMALEGHEENRLPNSWTRCVRNVPARFQL